MPIRRIAFRTAPGISKVLPVREASGLHIGPAGSKALFPGARATGARKSETPKSIPFLTFDIHNSFIHVAKLNA